MYISTSYDASVYTELANTTASSTSQKSLLDYMKDDDEKSNGISDTVTLSSEAYAAISENNPELLSILGYEEEEDSSLLSKSSGSSLDKVELSAEAYAVLKAENPEVLEALGYDISEDGAEEA
ncbi:MAG: hypothetical protein AB7E76_08205 [Deferribacterales bacterium]|jgi:hypothetical protein